MDKEELILEYGSIRAAARALGMPESTLRTRLKKEEGTVEDFMIAGYGGDSTLNELPEPKQPKKDALTAAAEEMGILPNEVAGAWLKTDKASIQVKRAPQAGSLELSEEFVTLLDKARKHVVRPSECRSADSMLLISPVDAHFGKLSYSKETGENYDPEITSLIYRRAVADSLGFFNPSRVKKIVLQIGQDFLNADNSNSQTTSGTVVESCDTRYTRVFDIAVSAVIAAVEDCVQIADVHVPVIPGNHDMLSSVLLAKVVKQYFKNDPRVFVDDDEIIRKYIRFGTNLIGMTHKFTKFDAAPVIMATERPKDWGETTCREFHTGHLHTTRAKAWTPYWESSGVVVRVSSSIAASDLWHYVNGYIGNCRAAESWLYSEETGIIGSHVAKVRE